MDFGVLAGYMLILDPETCRKNVMINLHPALPDSYKGTWEEIVQKVVDNDDDRYGAMVHICTPELDRGDVLSYDSFDVRSLRDPVHLQAGPCSANKGKGAKKGSTSFDRDDKDDGRRRDSS